MFGVISDIWIIIVLYAIIIRDMIKNGTLNDDTMKSVPDNGNNVWNYLFFSVNILELLYDFF